MTPTDAPLAPEAVARELAALARFDGALRQRMEGVLWMVLGLVFSTLFLAYAFAVQSDVPEAALAFLWVPWVAAGAAVVWGVRRGLALASADVGAAGWTWLLACFAVASGAVGGGIALVGTQAAPALALLAFSALALAPALATRLGFTPVARRVSVAVGGLGILAAIGALASGSGEAATWIGASVGLLWVAGGVYQALAE